jgi:EAL domain-containing protein (putative c-di-GMP-specific phosphodiesterase class I)
VSERLELESALRQSLVRRELLLHYQPRFDLKTGAVIGMEALLRWMHPERGMMLPDRFVPLAEETGLIVQIGEWVLRAACAQNRAWQEEGLRPVTVSVNLSARQFRQPDLVKSVTRVLEDTGLEPRHLEIELTESMVMHDAAGAIATLRALKKLGIGLSVDDFGTGYSSLSYLKTLPIDKLKIDQSFVRDVAARRGGDGGLLAQAILSLGHSLKLGVVAEGVETAAQEKFLRKHRCDEVQGYHFGKPIPPERCWSLLARSRRAAAPRR